MNRYKLTAITGMMLITGFLSATQLYDIRFELDEMSCLPVTVCYNVQLRSSNAQDWNLGGQNYRIFFDGSKASLIQESAYSVLPQSKYQPLQIIQVIENVDASSVSNILPFSNSLSFINYSVDLKNLSKGGVSLPANGEWISTSQLCFNLTEEALKQPISCMNMIWARKSLTEVYAPAYVVIAEWESSERLELAECKTYADLDRLNGCIRTDLITLEKQDILCFGDPYGSVDVLIKGTNGPYSVVLKNDSLVFDQLPAGIHEILVTDNLGCEFSRVVEIFEPQQLNIDILNLVNPMESGSPDGSVEVEITGGALPYSFEWTSGDVVISTEQNLKNAPAGTYVLKVIDSNECEVISQTIVLDAVTSVNDPEIVNKIQLYPNPAVSELNVRTLNPNLEILNLRLIGANGQSFKVSNEQSKYHNRVNVSDLIPGLYIAIVDLSGDRTVTQRIVKI